MGKPKKTLKATLHSHQLRMVKNKQTKALENQKVAAMKGKVSNAQAKPKAIVPYLPSDCILLVGEGDFSFAHSLVSSHGLHAKNITATAFDSESTCYEKYPWSQRTVEELKAQGMKILFNVDARKLGSVKELKSKQFSKVVFNFPHTGKGITDQDRNVLSNQELLVEFFKSVPSVMARGQPNVVNAKKAKAKTGEDSEDDAMEGGAIDESEDKRTPRACRGTVLVTLRDTVPYTLWRMPELAKKPSSGHPRYKQLRSFAFHPEQYPGYAHRRTGGHRGEREIPVLKEKDGLVNARTWEFELSS